MCGRCSWIVLACGFSENQEPGNFPLPFPVALYFLRVGGGACHFCLWLPSNSRTIGSARVLLCGVRVDWGSFYGMPGTVWDGARGWFLASGFAENPRTCQFSVLPCVTSCFPRFEVSELDRRATVTVGFCFDRVRGSRGHFVPQESIRAVTPAATALMHPWLWRTQRLGRFVDDSSSPRVLL